MAPRIEGEVHSFAEHGLYDGLFLMQDEESGTFWDHMTGEAVYGPLVGHTLEISNLLQTTVAQVLAEDPDAKIALSERAIRRDSDMKLDGLLSRIGGRLNRFFQETVSEEDDRLPTMDLGLGIWDGEKSRYYSYQTVIAHDKALIDSFEGRRVLVYLDPTAYALAGLYVDADGAEWDGDVLRLSNGSYVEKGVLRDEDGAKADVKRPLQVFTRWYGFSLTFPGTQIYGDGG